MVGNSEFARKIICKVHNAKMKEKKLQKSALEQNADFQDTSEIKPLIQLSLHRNLL